MDGPIQRRGLIGGGLFLAHACGVTDVGREREVNEDAMYFDEKLELFVVCDGMGGHTSGQLASQMAIRAIVNSIGDGSSQNPGGESANEPLVAAIEAANNTLVAHTEAHPEFRGMGTTAVGMRVEGDRAHICHVGDSRIYRLRGPSLQVLTRDHSLQNLYADKPELEGRLGPATSNVIVRAIGLEPQVAVDHRVVAIEEDDVFILCCDGLTDLVEEASIQQVLRSDAPLEVQAQQLVDAANRNGGTDNITIILVSILNKDGGFHSEDKTVLGF